MMKNLQQGLKKVELEAERVSRQLSHKVDAIMNKKKPAAKKDDKPEHKAGHGGDHHGPSNAAVGAAVIGGAAVVGVGAAVAVNAHNKSEAPAVAATPAPASVPAAHPPPPAHIPVAAVEPPVPVPVPVPEPPKRTHKDLFGNLTLTIHEAKNLAIVDRVGSQDPFVYLRLGGHEQKTKVATDAGINAKWEQTFHFGVDGQEGDESLMLVVLDSETIGQDRTIGFYQLDLLDATEKAGAQVQKTLQLEDMDGNKTGEVFVTIEWTPDKQP